ncbi:hypothetical protein ACXYL9_06700 [Qipengyuania sp. CAU 1752]
MPASELPAFTPVPRKCNRHDGWTEQRQCAFIEALADTGSVAAACKAVDMSTVGAYHLRRQPGAESFRKAWTAALDLGVQRIEDVAMDRALNGVEVPVYFYGKLVGTRRVYNDRLLMFMLRNRAPERFAGGKSDLKGLNAVGKMERRRLKKKWRKAWEAEREAERAAQDAAARAASGDDEDAQLAALDAKLERARSNWLAQLSPRTRAAWDAFPALPGQGRGAGL